MPASEHPLQALAAFLPDKSFEQVAEKENPFWEITGMLPPMPITELP